MKPKKKFLLAILPKVFSFNLLQNQYIEIMGLNKQRTVASATDRL